MQHLNATFVADPMLRRLATHVAVCKFENGPNCCTAQHDVASFGRVLQHFLHARMRIATAHYFRA